MRTLTAALIFFGTALASGCPADEGSARSDFFPERVKVAGKELSLNGVGTRTATLFAIKVYHAAFYSDRSIASLPDALAAPNPKRLEIRYVRDFDLAQTRDAWKYQFRESGGIPRDELTAEIGALVSLQLPIRRGDLQAFDFVDGKTLFSVNGEPRGEIPGASFQRALLTIFFGPNPPTRELQKGLTRGIHGTGET